MAMNFFKDEAIYATYMYMETKEIQYKEDAQKALKDLAKKYNFKIKKQASFKMDLKEAFKNFIQNKIGVTVTIPQLYNSL